MCRYIAQCSVQRLWKTARGMCVCVCVYILVIEFPVKSHRTAVTIPRNLCFLFQRFHVLLFSPQILKYYYYYYLYARVFLWYLSYYCRPGWVYIVLYNNIIIYLTFSCRLMYIFLNWLSSASPKSWRILTATCSGNTDNNSRSCRKKKQNKRTIRNVL